LLEKADQFGGFVGRDATGYAEGDSHGYQSR
jgi:hypothetical protein